MDDTHTDRRRSTAAFDVAPELVDEETTPPKRSSDPAAEPTAN